MHGPTRQPRLLTDAASTKLISRTTTIQKPKCALNGGINKQLIGPALACC